MRDYRTFAPLPIVGRARLRLRLGDGRELLDGSQAGGASRSGTAPAAAAGAAGTGRRLRTRHHRQPTSARWCVYCERLLAAANGLPPAHVGPAAPAGRAGHFGKVFLADNGSTAVEIAIKMAVQAQAQRGQAGRTRSASLANGYHGETIATLSSATAASTASLPRAAVSGDELGGLPYRSGLAPTWRRRLDGAGADAGDRAQLAAWPATWRRSSMSRCCRRGGMRFTAPICSPPAGRGRSPRRPVDRRRDRRRIAAAARAGQSPGAGALPDFAVLSKG